MQIHVLTTGGTIDKVYFDANSEFQVGSSMIAELLKEAHVTAKVTIEPVLAKDSLDLTDADRQLIRERAIACPVERILITHGTDTMVETGRALAGVAAKTIVLTGSMQPARFRSTDAVFNVGFALGALQSLPPGVYIAINGRIFDPQHVRKNREQQRFEEAD
ncbi:MAG TPA: asparaginase domain-containing protein [Gammaproteobacteria bacterium]|nr:asparaginase domain-containing protein [Gammaproteobacteria bacterium]